MVSSIKGKQYPPVQVDELGFFGFQIQDLQLPFEKVREFALKSLTRLQIISSLVRKKL